MNLLSYIFAVLIIPQFPGFRLIYSAILNYFSRIKVFDIFD